MGGKNSTPEPRTQIKYVPDPSASARVAQLEAKVDKLSRKRPKVEYVKEYVRDPELLRQIEEYQARNRELMEKYDELYQEIRDNNISSFDDLDEHYSKGAEALKRMAAATQPMQMTGVNFALFGITSSGKSTMLNQFLGKQVAATGAGETTTQVQRYDGNGFSLYDIPGKNDEISYFTMEYVAFWKALTARLVLITATVKEMTSVFRLLDAINLKYDIVVNKFDQHQEDERDVLKAQIHAEIKQIGLMGVENVWFISSKFPQMFDDWLQMVHSLTERPHKSNNMTRRNQIETKSNTSFFPQHRARSATSNLVQDQFAAQLQQLQSMGFDDENKNRRLLTKHNGDISSTINSLLNSNHHY
ncbi:unnamed protein product [Rotaria sp. Silwood2]|nr:unnamed protein product [Rotaria sp. Silwood2]CAF4566754.1 unnamed protein product [Rotaria sp. Silwood2]